MYVGNVRKFLLIEAAREKQRGVDMSSMRIFDVNLETKIWLMCIFWLLTR